MAPHQAQRTLVKSRPELWAEVSDSTSLCKHLGEFGDITITRLEPESTVAWEGTAARGTVELETSGWGTKVTLTAELLDVDVPQPDPVPEPEPAVVLTPRPARVPEDEERAVPDPAPAPEPAAAVVAEPVAAPAPAPAPAPARKPGFFARLFGRGKAPIEDHSTAAERAAVRTATRSTPLPEPEVLVVEPIAQTTPPEPPPEPTPLRVVPDLAPGEDKDPEPAPEDPEPLVAFDDGRALAVLTSALDDLGAAHRRPFSAT